MFYCAVDLEAWRKLKAETYEMPTPVELCNKYCSETVVTWYLMAHPGVIDPVRSIQYFFDQDEYFKAPFEEKWRHETKRARRLRAWNPWNSIVGITTADMRSIPGIQAADMVAYGVNRELTKGTGPYSQMPNIMRQVIPHYYKVWDEEALRQEFRPLIYRP